MKYYPVKVLLSLFMAFAISSISFEVLLHYYNPYSSRVRSGKITLPVNKSYIYSNINIPKINHHIIHTKNSLGFRGPELPKHFIDFESIITVGGSTTECLYLSDNEAWPQLVYERLKKTHGKIWINNAGLDGFSTFGIVTLLDDYIKKIQPKYILYLAGSNDIGKKNIGYMDKAKLDTDLKYTTIWNYIKFNSEIIDSIRFLKNNALISFNNNESHVSHHPLYLNKLSHIPLDTENIDELTNKHKRDYVPGYKKRLLSIISTCEKNSIVPIFITQPILTGFGFDELTKVNLETVDIGNGRSGRAEWILMDLYNETLRICAKENNVSLIDLAKKFPKGSRYYYDAKHFSIKGAQSAAEIISIELEKIIYPNPATTAY